jgi:hypothetical protein
VNSRLGFLALALASLASLVFYLTYRTQAFPEHAIAFGVSRDEAARRSAETLGLGPDWQSTTTFRVDDGAKTYLEREVGVPATTELAGETDLWHFTTRFYRPLQKEEHQVAIAPDGRVVGLRHLIDEAAAGARPSQADARARAEAFRSEQGLAGDWRLVEETTIERPNRLDSRFTWERADRPLPAAGDEPGSLRTTVLLQGDQVGEFRQFVKVPERWRREYARTRSSNNLVQTLDTVLGLLPLTVAMLVVFVQRFARGDLRPGPAIRLGVVGGVLGAVAVLNTLPTAATNYDTADSWESFLFQIVFGAVVAGVIQGMLIFLFAAVGESVYRQHFPNLLALGPGFTWRGATSRPGATALAIGALLCTVMAAYQVVYYFLGRAIGFWTPADVKYDDLFSALIPWLYPAVIGYTASTFEEFSFRLFAIPLLMAPFGRWLGSARVGLWAAIVLTAAVWGFLHSTYPQDPWFARGLEITLPGIVFGWLMVRFGILASLAVHYAFDAFVTAIVLDSANALPTSVAAYAIAAAPLLIAGWAWLRARSRGFPDAAPLLNAAQARTAARSAEAPREPAAWTSYQPLAGRLRWAVGLGGLAALGLVVASDLVAPPRQPFALNRAEASALAEAVVPGEGRQRVVTIENRSDELARAYLREHVGRDAVERYAALAPPLLWQVRYFVPLERDEQRVLLRPEDGSVFAVVHDLADATPGQRLSPADAQRLAAPLAAGRDGGEWRMVDQETIERASRTDHRLVFERTDLRFAGATVRAELRVVGDRVSGRRVFLKLPEEWERARTGTGLKEIVAILIPFGLISWLIGTAAFSFLGLARAGALSWRPALLAGSIFLALGAVDDLNALPLLYRGYRTELSIETFLTQRLAGSAAALALGAALLGAGAALMVGLWRQGVAPALAPTGDRRGWVLDALVVGAALPLTVLALARLVDAAMPGALGPLGGAPVGAGTYLPGLTALAGLRLPLVGAGSAIVAALLARGALGRWRAVVGLALLVSLAAALAQRSWPEALESGGAALAAVLLGAAAARWLLRDNLAAYFVAGGTLLLVAAAHGLLRAADGFLQANGVALVAVLVLGLLWARARMPAWRSDSASTRA